MEIDKSTKESIRQFALDAGFDLCGFTQPVLPKKTASEIRAWASAGYGGEMGWLVDTIDKRAAPDKAFPWAKSVICLGLHYDRPEPRAEGVLQAISRYAQGRSYHNVTKKRLKRICRHLTDCGAGKAISYCDTGPVPERQFAQFAGLGWRGKHSLLLNPEFGSYLFLAVVLCDLEIKPDSPQTDHCGTCTACIDACPTNAIVQEGVVDARRCISYLNIEHRGDFSYPYDAELHGWLHGCDVCQEVCPFVQAGRRRGIVGDPAFAPDNRWKMVSIESIACVDESTWDNLTLGSDVRRGGPMRLKRIARRLSPVSNSDDELRHNHS